MKDKYIITIIVITTLLLGTWYFWHVDKQQAHVPERSHASREATMHLNTLSEMAEKMKPVERSVIDKVLDQLVENSPKVSKGRKRGQVLFRGLITVKNQ